MNTTRLIPERPIEQKKDDIIGFSVFAENLAKSIVYEEKAEIYKSSGIVIGLTGEWGIGKSSILNLLEEHLIDGTFDTRKHKKNYKPIVVKFDPWLITDKREVLNQFFNELADKINDHHGFPGIYRDRYDQSIDEVTKKIRTYAKILTPLLDTGLAVFTNILITASEQDKIKTLPISKYKAEVETALDALEVPIVVLIDELDRVDNDEIKLMVQIVKSVLDFETISYVIAYDKNRIAEALCDDPNDIERGYSYLKKIIQIEIPIPILFDIDIKKYFEDRMCSIIGCPTLEQEFGSNYNRLEELYASNIFHKIISNCREANRLASAYLIRKQMVADEVSPVDIIAWEMLNIGYHEIASEIISEYPQSVSDNKFLSDILNKNDIGKFDYITLHHLIKFIFNFSVDLGDKIADEDKYILSLTFDEENRSETDILNRIPFFKLLRLGVQDDFIGRTDITKFLNFSKIVRKQILRKHYLSRGTNQSLHVFIEQFSGYVQNIEEVSTIKTAIISILEFAWSLHYTNHVKHAQLIDFTDVIRRCFHPIFLNLHDFKGFDFLNQLIERDLDHFAALFIRRHFYIHNLYGKRPEFPDKSFIDADQTKELAQTLVEKHLQSNNKNFKRILNSQLLYLFLDMGIWKDAEKRAAIDHLVKTSGRLDYQILFLYGGIFVTTSKSIDQMFPLVEFKNLVRSRIDILSNQKEPSVLQRAYDKASRELSIGAYILKEYY